MGILKVVSILESMNLALYFFEEERKGFDEGRMLW
jgi:hypothetical protein